MQLEIADHILRDAHLTPADIKLELALLLWQKGGLTEASAALLAGQDLPEFYALLRQRGLLPSQPVTRLKGMVPPPAQAVSLEQMQQAIVKEGGR
jgi:predicted HTH domain antitoxin